MLRDSRRMATQGINASAWAAAQPPPGSPGPTCAPPGCSSFHDPRTVYADPKVLPRCGAFLMRLCRRRCSTGASQSGRARPVIFAVGLSESSSEAPGLLPSLRASSSARAASYGHLAVDEVPVGGAASARRPALSAVRHATAKRRVMEQRIRRQDLASLRISQFTWSRATPAH